MSFVEAIEPRVLCATVVPGPLSLGSPDPGQSARVGSNPLSGGPFLGWTRRGQRVNYTIDAPQTETYAFTFQAATGSKNAAVHFEVDGTNLTGTLKLPNTHTWYNWQTVSLPAPLELLAGPHTLTLVIQWGSANFQGASFGEVPIALSDPPASPPATGPPMPGTQTGTGPAAPPVAGNWSLTFADEFNGTSLASQWTPHQYWNNGFTAGEGLEVSDPANVSVGSGALHLTARIDNSFGTQYTGGLVEAGGIANDPSVPTFSFLYG
ncbi:MAG TPA: carbohydrate-binding protein, partial [Tepidisphaeraceae bacterium]